MRKLVSRYLYVIGVLQLLGLNLAGFLWLAWAHGIGTGSRSSRRWVVVVHSTYVLLGAFLLCRGMVRADGPSQVRLFGSIVEVPRMVTAGVIILVLVIYGLPVVWLMSKSARREFYECEPRDR